jgi:hypothetical protein
VNAVNHPAGKRLIIQHGERIIRHELTGRPLIIGREPSCDLFFADQKLSRRHARIESGDEGVKLVDLGSRNGCWVNEQRVDEHVLRQDDKVRLGRLQITLEEDLPLAASPPAGGDATVVLPGTAVAVDEGGTVRMDLGAPATDRSERAAPPEDTVLFNKAQSADGDRTVVLPDAPSQGEEAGTVVFQSPVEDEATTSPAITTPPPTEGVLGSEQHVDTVKEELPPTAVAVARKPAAETHSGEAVARVGPTPLFVTVVLSFVAYLVVAVPLVLTLRGSLRQESLARGQTIVDLLAVQNGAALATDSLEELSVDSVGNQPGVEEAVILDVEGRVLIPSDRAGQAHQAFENVPEDAIERGGLYRTQAVAGDYDLVQPVIYQGERVGFVALRYSGVRVAERKSVPVLLFLGLLLIVGGAWGAYILTKKQALQRISTETTLS